MERFRSASNGLALGKGKKGSSTLGNWAQYASLSINLREESVNIEKKTSWQYKFSNKGVFQWNLNSTYVC